jgi:uncharacterized membrane protein
MLAPARSRIAAREDNVAAPTGQTRGRSLLGSLAVAVAAISAVGLVIILIGIALDVEGAREGEEGSVIFEIAWWSFFFGAIASLILGAAALLLGRRRGEPDTARAGGIALGWFGIALVIFLIASVLTS